MCSRGTSKGRHMKRAPAVLDVADWWNHLERHEGRVFSQNGEDGVLAEIFAQIGVTNRYCVEFGVQDGSECILASAQSEFSASRDNGTKNESSTTAGSNRRGTLSRLMDGQGCGWTVATPIGRTSTTPGSMPRMSTTSFAATRYRPSSICCRLISTATIIGCGVH